MGGWSREREISLLSGKNVLDSLQRQGFNAFALDIKTPDDLELIKKDKIDIAFVILHGKPGEDGTIQGLLELLGIPYTGSGVKASAIGTDKIITKLIFAANGIPTLPWVLVNKETQIKEKIEEAKNKLGFPLIIKPRYEGSSIGVEIIESEKNLEEKCLKALETFQEVFFEKYVEGMIATVGILRDRVLPILELIPKSQKFYDFKAKYTKGATEFIIPARLPEDVTKKIQEYALKVFKIIGCKGFARLDLVVEERKIPYFLEINTLPGMTDVSDLPAEAKEAGISYDEVVYEILESAIYD